jgi:hypothetical protein
VALSCLRLIQEEQVRLRERQAADAAEARMKLALLADIVRRVIVGLVERDSQLHELRGMFRDTLNRQVTDSALLHSLLRRRKGGRGRQADTVLADKARQAMCNLGYGDAAADALCIELLKLFGRSPTTSQRAFRRIRTPKTDK